jgi:hypothetical protein
VIVIQRVRVRWTAAGRGASCANARRGLDRATTLPAALPASDVVIHDVLADEVVGYVRDEQILAGQLRLAREVGLWLSPDGETVTVDRLPGRAAYPRPRPLTRLFAVESWASGPVPGELPVHRLCLQPKLVLRDLDGAHQQRKRRSRPVHPEQGGPRRGSPRASLRQRRVVRRARPSPVGVRRAVAADPDGGGDDHRGIIF